MGAHDCINHFSKDLDQKGIIKAVEQAVDDATYEYGHDAYNGTISTMHGPVQFVHTEAATVQEAEEHILEHHQKWRGPLAMKVKDGPWLVGGWAAS